MSLLDIERITVPAEALDPVPPLWLRILGVGLPMTSGLCYAAAAILGAGDTTTWFAYPTLPNTAFAFGIFLVGIQIAGIGCLLSRSWTYLRENLMSSGFFLGALVIGVWVGRDELAGPGAPWPARLLAHGALPVLALCLVLVFATIVIAQRALRTWPVRHRQTSPRLPRQVRALLFTIGALSLVMTVFMWFPLVDPVYWWPWSVGFLDRMVLAAIGVEVAVAMLTVLRSSHPLQMAPQAAILAASSAGLLIACFRFPSHLATGPQVPVFVLAASLGGGVGVALLMRLYRLPRW